MAEGSRRFCTLYAALELVTRPFPLRPKVHMCQELLEMQPGTSPARHWTYREEDFGGALVRMYHPRGGARNASSAGLSVLRKFCARHCLPVL
eukprot:1399708-Alexandrium_andersonii.AAC.1